MFFVCGHSQSISNRSNQTITVQDARWRGGLNAFMPSYADTTAANIQIGIDSAGAIIYTFDAATFWVRKHSPKRWVQIQTGVDVPFNPIQGYNMLLTGSYPNITFTADTIIGDKHLATQGYVDRHTPPTPTLQSVTGAGATTTIPTTFGGPLDSVGTRFSHNWGNSLASGGWSTALSSTTATVSGGKTNFSGGSGLNAFNYIYQSFYSGVENWTINQKVVCKAKNNTSYGFGFFRSPATAGLEGPWINYFLSDTAGYIAYTYNASLPVYSSSANSRAYTFQWSVGDTLQISIIQRSRLINMSMKNMRTGLKVELNVTDVRDIVGQWRIHFYGGDWDFINTFDLNYDEIERSNLGIIGNSIAWGMQAPSIEDKFFSRVSYNLLGGSISMTGPGETMANGWQRIDDIVNWTKPQYLLIEYGVNEFNAGVTVDSLSARLTRIINSCLAASPKVTPILMTLVPQVSSVVTYNDTINAIASRYGLYVADVYTALKNPSGVNLNPLYDIGDHVHPNNAGHIIEASIINRITNLLFQYNAPLVVSGMPIASNQQKIIGIDADGKLVAAYEGTSNSYIQNLPLYKKDGITVMPYQTADINIQGSGRISGSFSVVGSGSLSNPNFKSDSATSTVSAALFTSQNFSTISGGRSSINTGELYFQNNAQITGISQPLIVVRGTPGVGTHATLTLDNNTTGGVPSDYKIIDAKQNAARVFYVDRAGGLEADSTIRTPNIFTTTDTTNFKPVVVNSSGSQYKMTYWPTGSGGGGVTSVGTGFGVTGGPITTSGTIVVDTTSGGVTSWVRTKKVIDSLGALISAGGWALTGNSGTSAGTNYIGTSDNVAFDFRTNATQAMRLNTGQELLIGTTTDAGAYKIQVNGDIYTTGKFNINGNQWIFAPDQTNFAKTIYFGNNGASLSHGSGLEGQYGTYVGWDAAKSMTTGNRNTALGSEAMLTATTAVQNVAVGTDALYLPTAASQNVAIGVSAMQNAGNSISNSIGIGYQSLFNVTGTGNIGLGHSSGLNTTSGTENEWIGYFTGYQNQTGSKNVGVGSQALTGTASNSFSNNVAIGYKSGFAVTTASNNILLGYQAADALTTGGTNIAICYDCDLPSNTASNQLTIGNLIFATGGFGTGTSIGTGNVGIATAAPSARFHLPAGGTAANSAPEKYTSGSLLTSIEAFAKEVNANGTYQTSNALNRYAEGGYIKDFYTEVTNSGTSETDLYTYTTKANTFAADGEKVVALYSGVFTGSATATRTYRVYFGGTNIFNSSTFTTGVGATGGDWTIRVNIIRASSTSVNCVVEFIANLSGTSVTVTDYTTVSSLTLSGTNILKITGEAGSTGAGSDQIKAEMGTIQWYGAANN